MCNNLSVTHLIVYSLIWGTRAKSVPKDQFTQMGERGAGERSISLQISFLMQMNKVCYFHYLVQSLTFHGKEDKGYQTHVQ